MTEKEKKYQNIYIPEDLIDFRYCEKCKEVKPPRSHHCSVCSACIMRMDHHCPWVGNCVGLKNHKFFLNFLFYTALGATNFLLCILNARINENETFKEMFSRQQRV